MWQWRRIVSSTTDDRDFSMTCRPSEPKEDVPDSKSIVASFGNARSSIRCNRTWNRDIAGLSHIHGLIMMRSVLSKKSILHLFKAFCINWKAVPACMLFISFCVTLRFFSLTYPITRKGAWKFSCASRAIDTFITDDIGAFFAPRLLLSRMCCSNLSQLIETPNNLDCKTYRWTTLESGYPCAQKCVRLEMLW